LLIRGLGPLIIKGPLVITIKLLLSTIILTIKSMMLTHIMYSQEAPLRTEEVRVSLRGSLMF
jgi:hypothetical protein